MRNCCVFILSEMDTDVAMRLEGRTLTLHRVDRDVTLTGKQRGGALVICINFSWCLNTEVVFIVCSPFCLPRELSANIIVAVYIAPSAHVTEAMEVLHDIIDTQQTVYPDTFFIAAGDYNQASLKKKLYYQNSINM